MKQIKIKSIRIQNFKGCRELYLNLGDRTEISGANAVGKTTIFDAFTWLLFNKDSLGSSKFEIRPLVDGKQVDNIDIMVEAVVEVDGCEYALKKVQKQKWVKKRGSDERKFEGNVNEFEINEYPKSEKEFKEFIAGIIDEKLFNLLTNPNAFSALPWKEQREILMRFVGDMNDYEVAEKFGEQFKAIMPELKIAKTDEILAKYKKQKGMLNDQMKELPARIDELSKQLVHVNVAELELQRTANEVAIQKINEQLAGGNAHAEEIVKIKDNIFDLKMRQSEIQNNANASLDSLRREATANVNEAESEYNKAVNESQSLEYNKINLVRKAESLEADKEYFTKEWRRVKTQVFQEYVALDELKETDLICPTCGQDLPEDVKQKRLADYSARCEAHKAKYEADKANFEKNRQESLARITESGQKTSDELRTVQAKVNEINPKIKDAQDKRNSLVEKVKLAKQELSKVPAYADITSDVECVAISKKIAELENQIEELRKDNGTEEELKRQKALLNDEIGDINRKIAAADNSRIEARISELEDEKKLVGEKIAHTEQMIDTTEKFIQEKMNLISKSINGKFKVVSFKMFDIQINGGLKETCECTVDGVPYSSLNNGARITGGLDIVNSLAELYEISCPVWVDNAEAISDGNMPDMKSQMILMVVTNNKELKVEVK